MVERHLSAVPDLPDLPAVASEGTVSEVSSPGAVDLLEKEQSLDSVSDRSRAEATESAEVKEVARASSLPGNAWLSRWAQEAPVAQQDPRDSPYYQNAKELEEALSRHRTPFDALLERYNQQAALLRLAGSKNKTDFKEAPFGPTGVSEVQALRN